MKEAETQLVKNIEKEIDEYFLGHDFMKSDNRALAQWYLMMAHEETIRLPSVAGHITNWQKFIINNYLAREALRYALIWTDDLSVNKFTQPKVIDSRYASMAFKFFDLAENYTNVIAPFTLFHRNLVDVKFLNENKLVFSRKDEVEMRFEVLSLISTQNPESCVAPNNFLNPGERDEAEEEYEKIYKTIRRKGSERIIYKFNHENVKPFIELIQRNIPVKVLPDGWSFNGIYGNEFRVLFSFLKAVCFINTRCILVGAERLSVPGMGAVNLVYLKHKVELMAMAAKATGLDFEKIRAIIDLIIYDRSIEAPKRDFTLQPIMMMNEDVIGFCPFLVSTIDMERNLLAILARKDGSDRIEYDSKSFWFEKEMIGKLEKISSGLKFFSASNKSVVINGHKTEIDFVFYDKNKNVMFVCQCKFYIPPDDPREVLNRVEREQEGLDHLKNIKLAEPNSTKEIFLKCFPNLKIVNPKTYYGLVLYKSFGTKASIEAGIPTIEINYLEKNMTESKDLEEFCEKISRFGYLPRKDFDYIKMEIPSKIGKYEIVFEGYTILEH